MSMLVTIEGFGSIWSKRARTDSGNPERQRTAYYNTTGIIAHGKLRHRSRIFGQLRFNAVGGFNPMAIERNIGRIFQCNGNVKDGGPLLLHHFSERPAPPDYFLFAVSSDRTGVLPVESTYWKSGGVLLLSLSQFNEYQEAMLLMSAYSYLRGGMGCFVAEPLGDRPWRAFLRLVG
jgi:hypothetical protein